MTKFRKKPNLAQSIVEYCMFMAVFVMVLTSMQLYGKRGLQSVFKKTADQYADHRVVATVADAEEVPWRALVDPGTRGSNYVKNAGKNTVEGGVYKKSSVSEARNEHYGTSISAIRIDDGKYDSEYDPEDNIWANGSTDNSGDETGETGNTGTGNTGTGNTGQTMSALEKKCRDDNANYAQLYPYMPTKEQIIQICIDNGSSGNSGSITTPYDSCYGECMGSPMSQNQGNAAACESHCSFLK